MQKLTPEVIRQLNNLGGGFPPAPSGSSNEPQNDEQWILGDWTFECRVRPGVSVLGDLPLVDNTLGDVRFVIDLGAWYWWDGAAWQLVAGNGAVDSVTASTPLASSGGGNPDISFPSWPANAAGALTNDGSGGLSWAAAGGSRSVTFPSTVSATSTTGVAVGAVKLTFTVSPGAVGCECCVFSASPTQARIIVRDIGTVPIFIGSFVESVPTTGLRTLSASTWPNAVTGWINLTLDQINAPIAPVTLRGVFLVES